MRCQSGAAEQQPQMCPLSGFAHLVHTQLGLEQAVGEEVDFTLVPVSHSLCLGGAPALPAAQVLPREGSARCVLEPAGRQLWVGTGNRFCSACEFPRCG